MNKTLIKELYKKYSVPAHVVKHMQKVAEVCEIIADALTKNGITVDKGSLLTAAHIHDSLRIIDFRIFDPENFPSKYSDEDLSNWYRIREKFDGKRHENTLATEIEKDFPKIAALIRKHGFYSVTDLLNWEEKILYYADKRVEEDKIVDLQERFKNGRVRNFKKENRDLEKIKDTEKRVHELEKELESKIPDLQELLTEIS